MCVHCTGTGTGMFTWICITWIYCIGFASCHKLAGVHTAQCTHISQPASFFHSFFKWSILFKSKLENVWRKKWTNERTAPPFLRSLFHAICCRTHYYYFFQHRQFYAPSFPSFRSFDGIQYSYAGICTVSYACVFAAPGWATMDFNVHLTSCTRF